MGGTKSNVAAIGYLHRLSRACDQLTEWSKERGPSPCVPSKFQGVKRALGRMETLLDGDNTRAIIDGGEQTHRWILTRRLMVAVAMHAFFMAVSSVQRYYLTLGALGISFSVRLLPVILKKTRAQAHVFLQSSSPSCSPSDGARGSVSSAAQHATSRVQQMSSTSTADGLVAAMETVHAGCRAAVATALRRDNWHTAPCGVEAAAEMQRMCRCMYQFDNCWRLLDLIGFISYNHN